MAERAAKAEAEHGSRTTRCTTIDAVSGRRCVREQDHSGLCAVWRPVEEAIRRSQEADDA